MKRLHTLKANEIFSYTSRYDTLSIVWILLMASVANARGLLHSFSLQPV